MKTPLLIVTSLIFSSCENSKEEELKIEHAKRRKEREEVNAKAKESREYWKKKAKQIR